jgi:hypothetical protein
MSKASQRRLAEHRSRESRHGFPSKATLKALIRDGGFLAQFEPAKYLRLMGETLPADLPAKEDPGLLAMFERHKPLLATLGKVAFERTSPDWIGYPSVPGFMIFDNAEESADFPQYGTASVVWRHNEEDFDYEWEIERAFERTKAGSLIWVFSSDGQPKVMFCICASRKGASVTRILAKDVWVTPRSSHLARVLLCSEARMHDVHSEELALVDLVDGMRKFVPGEVDDEVLLDMEDMARTCVDSAQWPYLTLALTMTAAAREARVALAKATTRLEEVERSLAAASHLEGDAADDRLAKAYAREIELRAALARAESTIASEQEARSALALPGRLAEFF